MPVGWFIAPYVRRAGTRRPTRYVVVDDLTAVIRADGGDWAETEVLGQAAIAKVRASAATLALVAALPGVTRIPVARLDDPLASLSAGQKAAIRSRVQALGYTLPELAARFPSDLGTYTLRELLAFVAQRRRMVRYDVETDAIVDDGAIAPVRPLDDVDAAVG